MLRTFLMITLTPAPLLAALATVAVVAVVAVVVPTSK